MDFDYSISINILGMFLKMDTINALNAIFENHKNDRICVLGTICCGKSTL